MFTSETPICLTSCAAAAPTRARCRAMRRSGSVTISTSGVPPRLKSTSEAPEPWMRPDSPTWISFAGVLLEVDAMDADVAEPARRVASGMSYWLIW